MYFFNRSIMTFLVSILKTLFQISDSIITKKSAYFKNPETARGGLRILFG